jgi:hypothetical protein
MRPPRIARKAINGLRAYYEATPFIAQKTNNTSLFGLPASITKKSEPSDEAPR